jgi:hypothetical protein
MSNTSIAYGSGQQVKIQSVGLFAASMQRKTGLESHGRQDEQAGRR